MQATTQLFHHVDGSLAVTHDPLTHFHLWVKDLRITQIKTLTRFQLCRLYNRCLARAHTYQKH